MWYEDYLLSTIYSTQIATAVSQYLAILETLLQLNSRPIGLHPAPLCKLTGAEINTLIHEIHL